ncbi:MAG TPA: TetR/AcrR family transcriptional regulator [Acidimicrobiales bacterium]|jgi:AcrR family transcriptional regulator|nr:TetR/AcrR family transcriptional regulator [Acidimicrobiales bacterium]
MAKSGTKAAVGQPASAGSEESRQALVRGAVEALRDVGYAGASAREIARRAGCNQGLVFYYFGSVPNLLLAALDEVSETRRLRYQEAVDRASGLAGLVDTAQAVFEEDLDAGHIAVLAEMIAGATSTPGLAPEVAARIAPWRTFAADAVGGVLDGTSLPALVEPDLLAHAIVALYLGLEMLAHLDGDRAPALSLFDRARQLTGLLEMFGAVPVQEEAT